MGNISALTTLLSSHVSVMFLVCSSLSGTFPACASTAAWLVIQLPSVRWPSAQSSITLCSREWISSSEFRGILVAMCPISWLPLKKMIALKNASPSCYLASFCQHAIFLISSLAGHHAPLISPCLLTSHAHLCSFWIFPSDVLHLRTSSISHAHLFSFRSSPPQCIGGWHLPVVGRQPASVPSLPCVCPVASTSTCDHRYTHAILRRRRCSPCVESTRHGALFASS